MVVGEMEDDAPMMYGIDGAWPRFLRRWSRASDGRVKFCLLICIPSGLVYLSRTPELLEPGTEPHEHRGPPVLKTATKAGRPRKQHPQGKPKTPEYHLKAYVRAGTSDSEDETRVFLGSGRKYCVQKLIFDRAEARESDSLCDDGDFSRSRASSTTHRWPTGQSTRYFHTPPARADNPSSKDG